MRERSGRQGCIILIILIGIVSLIPLTIAADIEQAGDYQGGISPPEIPVINQSDINTSALDYYHATPSPVTIFRAEVSETSLPGPRYMAFGPSTITFSADPMTIFILGVFAILGTAAAGFWICRYNKQ